MSLVACQNDGHHAHSFPGHCHGECLPVVALGLPVAAASRGVAALMEIVIVVIVVSFVLLHAG